MRYRNEPTAHGQATGSDSDLIELGFVMALPTFGFSEEADMDSLITVVYRLRDFAFTIDQGETSTNVIILGVTYEEEELDPPCLRGLLLEDEETVVLIPLETIDRFTYRSVRRAP